MPPAFTLRELPLNPYASEPLSVWETRLTHPGSSETRFRAFDAIAHLASAAVACQHALKLLGDADAELRAAAAHWLSTAIRCRLLETELAPNAQAIVDHLKTCLTDSDPDVRFEAARGLVCLTPESSQLAATICGLVALEGTSSTTQAALAELCGLLPHLAEQLASYLRTCLTADAAEVREAAATAFARWGARASQSEPELATALDDEEPLVREQAAIALGQMDGLAATTLAALRHAAQDEDAGVAAAAQAALHRQGVGDRGYGRMVE